MGIFEKIRNAIFRRGADKKAQTGGQAPASINRGAPGAGGTGAATGGAAAAGVGGAAAAQARPATPMQPTAQSAPTPVMAEVDVEEVLEDLARDNPQKLNWRTSIVDLMKLLDLDSSLDDRKELAKELGYTGSTSDSAAMNVWLHKQVMRKLAENGGKVPASLRD